MNADRDVQLFLRAHFDATADRTIADGQVDSILAATAGHRQQSAWLASLRSLPMSTTARSLGRPISAPAWALLLILALLIATAAVGLTVGGWRPTPAPVLNGPIVFGRFDPAVSDTVIHSIRPDGSALRVVLAGPNECPQFSPDGRQLAIASVPSSISSAAIAMKVVDVDGTNVRSLPNHAGRATLGCSTWSPDGSRLAVEGFADNDPSANGIFLVNSSDGSDVVQLTANGQGGNDVLGDFSPDGSQLSFIRATAGTESGTLWIVDLATGESRQVSSLELSLGTTWSPDGQWIVGSRADRFVVVRPNGADLYELRVPANVGGVGNPSFSPDGTRLVFRMGLAGAPNNDIYTMKLDGTDLVQLTDTPDDNEYFTDWGIDPR
jgi:WD40 repeat protein